MKWTEQIINREVVWHINERGELVYEIHGQRENYFGSIVKPEMRAMVMFTGKRTNIRTPDDEYDQLKNIADLWGAKVAFRDGNVYNPGSETPVVMNGEGSVSPYFPHT